MTARPLDLAALEPLLDIIAAKVAARIVAHQGASAAPPPAHYHQDDAPVSKRVFLAAARAGAFPSSKRGKRVFALRADVDAWVAAGKRVPRASTPAPAENAAVHPPSPPAIDTSDEALLAQAGVRLTRGARRGT